MIDAAVPRRPSGSLAQVPYRELALALRTLSVKRIAALYGVSTFTVRYWRDKLGVPPLQRPPGRGHALQPLVLTLLHEHPEGCTTAELVRALGEPSGTLYHLLMRLVRTHQILTRREAVPGKAPRARWFLPSQAYP